MDPQWTAEYQQGTASADLGPTGTVKLQRMQKPRPKASSVAEALAALMDFPHPLDILGEPNSYGPDGAISRYHNPDNYTRALGGVVNARTRSWRALFGEATNSIGDLRSGSGLQEQSMPSMDMASECPQGAEQSARMCSDSMDEGHSSSGGFMQNIPRPPWFRRLAEEEGTAQIRVGKQQGPTALQPDEPPSLSEKQGSSLKPASPPKRARLPELHRIQVPPACEP
ncbi:hypothetical protein WJX84_006672 [Apatococcus fuscideae]|uniref:Uncharacterized protein n=1 Tax=Apatococcus fuscideae TaxID=2026836 RepID=A0AAW1T012_9CHLO